MRLIITSNYGFDHNWTLEYRKKQYYLGQDVKFCNIVLGMQPSYIINQIGTREIDNGTKGNIKLAKFIAKQLKITKTSNKWEFCAE